MHDKAGVTFSLPHSVDAETRPGSSPGVAARIYQDRLGDLGLSVSVVQAKIRFPANYAKSTLAHMTGLIEQGGADKVKLSRLKKVKVAKGRGLDATLSFIATDGATNYWRTRTITLGSTMVQAQVIQFSDGSDQAMAEADSAFDQLVASLKIN